MSQFWAMRGGGILTGSASVVMAAFCFTACQYDPHAHLYTTEKPLASQVVGVYRITSETLLTSDLSDLGSRSCLVRLNRDGTFEAANVPPWDVDAPGPRFFDRLLSGSGTWRVGSMGTVKNGWSSNTVWGVYLDSATIKLAPAHLIGHSPPYGLIFSVGDPDAGQVLTFTRDH